MIPGLRLVRRVALVHRKVDFRRGHDGLLGTSYEYGYEPYSVSAMPLYVHTVRRVHHVNDQAVPPQLRDRTVESRKYYDGFGRVVQKRILAEESRLLAVSGGGGVLPVDDSQNPDV